MDTPLFRRILEHAHIPPTAPRVQVGKAFAELLAECFGGMLCAVERKRKKVIPLIQIRLTAKPLFAGIKIMPLALDIVGNVFV